MTIVLLPHIFAVISTMMLFNVFNDNYWNYHVIVSWLSYSLLFAAFILSFLLNYQKKLLHQGNINNVISKMPPLETTEKILFTTIYTSFLLLTVVITHGIMISDDIITDKLAHKTVFSIISWVILLALVFTKLVLKLRDKKAIISVRVAFIMVVVGYFGTKIALYVIDG